MKKLVRRWWRRTIVSAFTLSFLVFGVAAAPQGGHREHQATDSIRPVQNNAGDARLLLGFADRSGIYLANVRVFIKDHNGNQVTQLVTEGPWLDLGMTPGVYHVVAVFEGAPQELRNVRLAERATTTMVLYWDLKMPSTEMMARAQAAKAV